MCISENKVLEQQLNAKRNSILFVDSLFRNHANLISASENTFGEKKIFQELYASHTLEMSLKNSRNWVDKYYENSTSKRFAFIFLCFTTIERNLPLLKKTYKNKYGG